MGIFTYSRNIKELECARLLPDNRTCNADILDSQIATAETALRSPTLSADRAVEVISRLDCAKACAGFASYFLDLFEKTVFTTQRHMA